MAFVSLGPIRNIYATLHEGTDSAPTQYSASTGNRDAILWDPSSYPLCNISAHHSDSTPHTHDVSASTAINRAVILDNIAPAPLSPDSAPYVPSSYVPVALHDSHSENRMDVPLLDNNIPASFHPTRHTAIENTPVPTTSSDPATAVGDRQDIETSVRTMLPTTSASSTFASFVSPTSAVSLQNTTDRLVRSDAPEIPSTASPGPVLDEITGTYPWPTSAPDLGTAEGSTMIGSRDNMDAPNPTSVDRPIQANTVAPDLSLQPLSPPPPPPPPPPLPSATDIVMAGPSEQAFDAERTWDELPHTSHG
ncbi:hypothetical protein EI94DRAFT_1760739 [Lactarius quietus]|nr:hypothetical protein EI94DRAFT_1760739 [Lactarius quietus]